jgi:hypothetical protein
MSTRSYSRLWRKPLNGCRSMQAPLIPNLKVGENETCDPNLKVGRMSGPSFHGIRIFAFCAKPAISLSYFWSLNVHSK